MTQQARNWPTQAGQVIVTKGKVMTPIDANMAPHQYGESKNNSLELLLAVNLPEFGRQATTPLYFSKEAAPYSYERLRACGWEGENLANLKGVDKNEIDIEVRCELYDGKTQTKVQILSGGGRFSTAKPMTPAEFAAKVQAMGGPGGSGGSTGAPPPPF